MAYTVLHDLTGKLSPSSPPDLPLSSLLILFHYNVLFHPTLLPSQGLDTWYSLTIDVLPQIATWPLLLCSNITSQESLSLINLSEIAF